MWDSFTVMDKARKDSGEGKISSLVYPSMDHENDFQILTQTENAQPAIGTIGVGLFKSLKRMGLEYDATLGHSYGELSFCSRDS